MAGFDVGDVYRIKATSLFQGDVENPLQNTFWYKVTSTTGGGNILFTPDVTDPLLDDFLTAVITPLLPAQVSAIEWTELEITEWTNPLRPFQKLLLSSQNGGSSSTAFMPVWVNYSFRLNRSNNTTRNGQKRYAGVPEEAQQAGVVPPGTYRDILDLAAAGLSEGLTATDGIDSATLLPCIVRLAPVTQEVVLSQFCFSAQYVRLSTQDSRKG